MKKFFSSKKFIVTTLIVVFITAAYFYNLSNIDLTSEIEIGEVTKGDVKEVISETGFVEASRDVTLAFERSGRVVSLPAKKGMFVEAGSVLIELDKTELLVELSAANARLYAEQVRLGELLAGADKASLDVTGSVVDSAKTNYENAKLNLIRVKAQQDQLVANAEKTLMVSGLQAYLVSKENENSRDSFTAPTITGTYDSSEAGVYRIDLYNSSSQSGSSYRLSGLEEATGQISTVNSMALGTRGLFIQFPENFASRTSWEVSIPNIKSSVYLANLNSYQLALETSKVATDAAESAVKSAEAALTQTDKQYEQVSSSARDERVEAQRALIKQMQSAVESVQIAIDKTTLRAPFSGTITNVLVEEGEIVSPSVPLVSIISDDNFELTVNISESDIQELSIDDTASVIFDAYDEMFFAAKVVRIAPVATLSEGVRIFEVILQFVDKDERIRAGLSADIDILAAERINVIAIPTRSVVEREDGKFVRTWDGVNLKYLPVETGLRGSDGMTEIISGLSEGEKIVTFAREEAINKLNVSN